MCPSSPSSASHSSAGDRARAARRFLVVAPSVVTQRIIARTLERHGHDVAAVGSGGDAAALLDGAGRAFDHVIVDLRLPDVDALELIVGLRGLTGERVRISALSSAASGSGREAQDRERSVEAGADALLLKPLRADDLEELALGGDAGAEA